MCALCVPSVRLSPLGRLAPLTTVSACLSSRKGDQRRSVKANRVATFPDIQIGVKRGPLCSPVCLSRRGAIPAEWSERRAVRRGVGQHGHARVAGRPSQVRRGHHSRPQSGRDPQARTDARKSISFCPSHQPFTASTQWPTLSPRVRSPPLSRTWTKSRPDSSAATAASQPQLRLPAQSASRE